MSKSTHTFNLEKDGTTYECELYTTPEEARNNIYPGRYLNMRKDDVDLFLPLTTVMNSDEESTPLKVVKKGDPTQYCVAQKSFFRANITPVQNAAITAVATYGASERTRWNSGARWLPYGTELSISVIGNPSNIWSTPNLLIESGTNPDSMVLTESNMEISCTVPERIVYTITIAATANQTITVYYTEPGKGQVAAASSPSGNVYLNVLAGTTWTATLYAATGYTAGVLSATSGTVTSATTISASNAQINYYTLALGGTVNQTITLWYTQPGAGTAAIASAPYTQYLSVAYGTRWSAAITPAPGYYAGNLSGTSGVVTGYTAVTASGASPVPASEIIVTIVIQHDVSWKRARYTANYTNSGGGGSSISAGPSVNETRTIAIKPGTAVSFTLLGEKQTDPREGWETTNVRIWCGGTCYVDRMGSVQWSSWGITSSTTFVINAS